MAVIISNLSEYESFEFESGQEFKVVNAKYKIKDVNGVLFVTDLENYGSKIKQKGQSDHLKHALECNQIIKLTSPIH